MVHVVADAVDAVKSAASVPPSVQLPEVASVRVSASVAT